MPNGEGPNFAWEGEVRGEQVMGALLEMALLNFSHARMFRENKNTITPREIAKEMHRVVEWANIRFPGLNVRIAD